MDKIQVWRSEGYSLYVFMKHCSETSLSDHSGALWQSCSHHQTLSLLVSLQQAAPGTQQDPGFAPCTPHTLTLRQGFLTGSTLSFS